MKTTNDQQDATPETKVARAATGYAPDHYDVTIRELSTYPVKRGNVTAEWCRVIATDGEDVEFLITNPRLPRLALGDVLRITLEVVERA